MIDSKYCKKCSTEKPLSEFPGDRSKKDGRNTVCKVCQKIAAAARRGVRGPEGTKDNNLRSGYGITLDEYNLMRKAQNYSCPLCGRNEAELGYELIVDHDHRYCKPQKNVKKRSCGKCIRGLLCENCNLGIGHLKESIDTITNALTYLKLHSK